MDPLSAPPTLPGEPAPDEPAVAQRSSMARATAGFPDVYRDYVNQLDARSAAVLLVRNGLLVALLATLAWPARPRGGA